MRVSYMCSNVKRAVHVLTLHFRVQESQLHARLGNLTGGPLARRHGRTVSAGSAAVCAVAGARSVHGLLPLQRARPIPRPQLLRPRLHRRRVGQRVG
eukprot:1649562-Prymnesium_polylepis.1